MNMYYIGMTRVKHTIMICAFFRYSLYNLYDILYCCIYVTDNEYCVHHVATNEKISYRQWISCYVS